MQAARWRAILEPVGASWIRVGCVAAIAVACGGQTAKDGPAADPGGSLETDPISPYPSIPTEGGRGPSTPRAGGEAGSPRLDPYVSCGDGYVDPGEQCDDANRTPGDGCNADCCIESNFNCPQYWSPPCHCGDGILSSGEQCDDGNDVNGDGCNVVCHIEPDPCGNGRLDEGEACDDGGHEAMDGCGPWCQLETCVLTIICGNGIVEGTEVCDDGNTVDGDGCSADCSKLEG